MQVGADYARAWKLRLLFGVAWLVLFFAGLGFLSWALFYDLAQYWSAAGAALVIGASFIVVSVLGQMSVNYWWRTRIRL